MDGEGNGPTALKQLCRRYEHHKRKSDTPKLEKLGPVIATLVAAGDYAAAIPFACPGLEAALVPVWKAEEDNSDAKLALPAIFQRLEDQVQARVRTALLTLHRFCPSMPKELRWDIMEASLA